MQTIYFDEAGFTGDALLDPDQPYFVYTGVAVEDAQARQLLDELRGGTQMPELKGRVLVRRPAGRQRVIHLMEALQTRFKVAVFHKKMALSYKLFEYVFEPVLAKFSSFYYRLGFHYFVGQNVYLSAFLGEELGVGLLREFQALMRRGDVDGAMTLFGTPEVGAQPLPMELIREFASLHARQIRKEVLDRQEDGVTSWLLDLTSTALNSLLGEFADEYDLMQPVCDVSKPLVGTAGLFNGMIGRTDVKYINGPRYQARLTYNLAGPIQLRPSNELAGLQIADAISSATGWALRNRADEDAQRIIHLTDDHISKASFDNSLDDIDVGASERAMINWFVLNELVRRSRNRDSLIDGMPEMVEIATASLRKGR